MQAVSEIVGDNRGEKLKNSAQDSGTEWKSMTAAVGTPASSKWRGESSPKEGVVSRGQLCQEVPIRSIFIRTLQPLFTTNWSYIKIIKRWRISWAPEQEL